MKNKKFVFYIFTFFASLFIFINNTFAVDITANTTISTNTTYDSLVVKSGATLTVDASLTITWDALIEYWWIITHTQWSTTQSNLIVSWTLTINSWGKIDMNWKWIATTWAWSQTVWASHGWYGIYSNTVPYWDIYNPISVWSYWRNTSYPWWWLVRMTVWNLVNNWSISANWSNITRWQGSWWSINITVNWNISWNWTYQANWWWTTSYNWWGWRVAIKYNTVSNLATLKSKVSAIWPKNAWEWTIYLKDLTTSYQILIIKGDWSDKWTSTSTNMNNFNEVILDFWWLSLVWSNPWNITNWFYLNSWSFLNSNSTSPITVSWTLSVSSW